MTEDQQTNEILEEVRQVAEADRAEAAELESSQSGGSANHGKPVSDQATGEAPVDEAVHAEEDAPEGDQPQDAVEDEAAELSDELTERAKELGWSDEALERETDPAALEQRLDDLDVAIAYRMKLAREQAAEQQSAQADGNGQRQSQATDIPPDAKPRPTQSPQGQQQASPAAPEQFQLKELSLDDDLDHEVWSQIKENFQGLHGELGRQAQAMSGKIQQLEQALGWMFDQYQQQQAQATAEQFDSMLDGLGDDYADVLGKGRTAKMPKSSEARRNREQVAEMVEALYAGYESTGRQVPSMDVLVNRAVNAVLGNRVTRKQVERQVRDRQGRFTARPTHRRGATDAKDEREKALDWLRTEKGLK